MQIEVKHFNFNAVPIPSDLDSNKDQDTGLFQFNYETNTDRGVFVRGKVADWKIDKDRYIKDNITNYVNGLEYNDCIFRNIETWTDTDKEGIRGFVRNANKTSHEYSDSSSYRFDNAIKMFDSLEDDNGNRFSVAELITEDDVTDSENIEIMLAWTALVIIFSYEVNGDLLLYLSKKHIEGQGKATVTLEGCIANGLMTVRVYDTDTNIISWVTNFDHKKRDGFITGYTTYWASTVKTVGDRDCGRFYQSLLENNLWVKYKSIEDLEKAYAEKGVDVYNTALRALSNFLIKYEEADQVFRDAVPLEVIRLKDTVLNLIYTKLESEKCFTEES